MKSVIIIAIIISIVVGIGFAVFLSLSIQPKNSENTDEKQSDEVAWQLYQKTYLEQECRELYIGQPEELEDCYDRIEEEQRLNPPISEKIDTSSNDCSGNAKCILGTVTSIIDGDTIKIESQSIRFALSSAPELNEIGGDTAREFIEELCPVGSSALVDEDDGQTEGSYGRIIGVITCNGINLNEELLDANLGYLLTEFCSSSEFANDSWAQKYGCDTDLVSISEHKVTLPEIQNDCDSSYPDFCIPSSPPDLDCGDIAQKKFTVLYPDPHRFDGDKDGIGCES